MPATFCQSSCHTRLRTADSPNFQLCLGWYRPDGCRACPSSCHPTHQNACTTKGLRKHTPGHAHCPHNENLQPHNAEPQVRDSASCSCSPLRQRDQVQTSRRQGCAVNPMPTVSVCVHVSSFLTHAIVVRFPIVLGMRPVSWLPCRNKPLSTTVEPTHGTR